jgi:hypothetical protein
MLHASDLRFLRVVLRLHPVSAGIEAGELNPLEIEVMREVGVDISDKRTQSVFDLFRSGKLFAYVGSWDEKLARTRIVRDQIRAKVEELCATICSPVAQPHHK